MATPAMATIGGAVLVTMGVGVWATLNATASTVDPQTSPTAPSNSPWPPKA